MTARLPLVVVPPDREPTLADVMRAIRELATEVHELRAAIALELAERRRPFVALQGQFGSVAFTALDALEAAAERPNAERARVPHGHCIAFTPKPRTRP